VSGEPRIIVEPAGRSEADWSSAPLSSAGLPEFVEGEFTHMIELGGEPPEDDDAERPLAAGVWGEGDAPSEQERIAALDRHMTALLEVAGKNRDVANEGIGGLFSRFADRWAGE
jgi:hypothetical protein